MMVILMVSVSFPLLRLECTKTLFQSSAISVPWALTAYRQFDYAAGESDSMPSQTCDLRIPVYADRLPKQDG